jgi:hypothetical protein
MAPASAAKAEIIDECMRLSRCWKHTARFSAGVLPFTHVAPPNAKQNTVSDG